MDMNDITVPFGEAFALELSRLEREAIARVTAKIAAQQLGEAFQEPRERRTVARFAKAA
jgi:hypothetical protein